MPTKSLNKEEETRREREVGTNPKSRKYSGSQQNLQGNSILENKERDGKPCSGRNGSTLGI